MLSKLSFLPDLSTDEVSIWVKYLKQVLSGEQYKDFWKYFDKTWMNQFPPVLWAHGTDSGENIVRTNNALERYNRRLSERMVVPHGSIGVFVQVLQAEFKSYSDYVTNIRRGVDPFPKHHERTPSTLPKGYLEYKRSLQKKTKHK